MGIRNKIVYVSFKNYSKETNKLYFRFRYERNFPLQEAAEADAEEAMRNLEEFAAEQEKAEAGKISRVHQLFGT